MSALRLAFLAGLRPGSPRPAPGRLLRRRLRLEAVESRTAPAIIGGTVFFDANANGTRETTVTYLRNTTPESPSYGRARPPAW